MSLRVEHSPQLSRFIVRDVANKVIFVTSQQARAEQFVQHHLEAQRIWREDSR